MLACLSAGQGDGHHHAYFNFLSCIHLYKNMQYSVAHVSWPQKCLRFSIASQYTSCVSFVKICSKVSTKSVFKCNICKTEGHMNYDSGQLTGLVTFSAEFYKMGQIP